MPPVSPLSEPWPAWPPPPPPAPRHGHAHQRGHRRDHPHHGAVHQEVVDAHNRVVAARHRLREEEHGEEPEHDELQDAARRPGPTGPGPRHRDHRDAHEQVGQLNGPIAVPLRARGQQGVADHRVQTRGEEHDREDPRQGGGLEQGKPPTLRDKGRRRRPPGSRSPENIPARRGAALLQREAGRPGAGVTTGAMPVISPGRGAPNRRRDPGTNRPSRCATGGSDPDDEGPMSSAEATAEARTNNPATRRAPSRISASGNAAPTTWASTSGSNRYARTARTDASRSPTFDRPATSHTAPSARRAATIAQPQRDRPSGVLRPIRSTPVTPRSAGRSVPARRRHRGGPRRLPGNPCTAQSVNRAGVRRGSGGPETPGYLRVDDAGARPDSSVKQRQGRTGTDGRPDTRSRSGVSTRTTTFRPGAAPCRSRVWTRRCRWFRRASGVPGVRRAFGRRGRIPAGTATSGRAGRRAPSRRRRAGTPDSPRGEPPRRRARPAPPRRRGRPRRAPGS